MAIICNRCLRMNYGDKICVCGNCEDEEFTDTLMLTETYSDSAYSYAEEMKDE